MFARRIGRLFVGFPSAGGALLVSALTVLAAVGPAVTAADGPGYAPYAPLA